MRFYSPRVGSVVQLPFCFTHFVVAYHHHMEFDPVVDYCGHHMWTPYVDSDVDEEFEFKNVETGKGNRFREDKNVSNNHILKKEIH
jgi:hypothetical protein